MPWRHAREMWGCLGGGPSPNKSAALAAANRRSFPRNLRGQDDRSGQRQVVGPFCGNQASLPRGIWHCHVVGQEAPGHPGGLFCDVSCVATPQSGLEVFVTVEWPIWWCTSRGCRLHPWALGGCRLLARLKRESTKCGLSTHGPRSANARKANLHLRQVLSDMGAELSIADAAKVAPDALGHEETLDNLAYLYPLALCVPGVQHLLCLVLQLGLGNSARVASVAKHRPTRSASGCNTRIIASS